MREIAQDAEVNFGLIRYHYGDKLGLYRACIEKYGQMRFESAKRFLTPAISKDDFTTKLKYAIEDIILNQITDVDLTRMVLHEIEESGARADDILGSTLVQMAKRFVEFFTEAKKAGYLRKDLDPLLLTYFIQGSINHFVRTDGIRSRHFKFSVKDEKNRHQLVEHLYQLVLNGCLNQ
ncbi:MAG: hypothetical protein BroJett040_20110 [Oligoflexia bacterium]|nr:MAG: hypothetical protein BroJett040_20110 [Oligoflexia bacterium]